MEDEKQNSVSAAQQPFWTSPAVFADHFLAPFYKTDTAGSFGKLWSSICLVVCMWFWLHLRKDIPQTLESMTWVLLAYTFTTKGVQIVRDKVTGKASISSAGSLPQDTSPTVGTNPKAMPTPPVATTVEDEG